ncbi:MAG: DUF2752 domain-containing protein [Rikenellaceae bacterium]|nr:DUF2752 domain-containing protein [Rikenellaceae bacterium]
MQLRDRGRNVRLLIATIVLLVLVGAVLFYVFVPSEYWPRCWWLLLTGTKCPGCGTQRAIAALLSGDICGATSYNPILVVGIPYFLLSIWCDCGKNTHLKYRTRNLFFSAKALKITVIVIIAYWIGRNLF